MHNEHFRLGQQMVFQRMENSMYPHYILSLFWIENLENGYLHMVSWDSKKTITQGLYVKNVTHNNAFSKAAEVLFHSMSAYDQGAVQVRLLVVHPG